MRVTELGSVRVDLVGGTLDLEPINLILKNSITLNVATSLEAKVTLATSNYSGIRIKSLDYNDDYEFKKEDLTDDNLYFKNKFSHMSFVLQIIDLFNIRANLDLTLSSGAPAGSGLGGSSAMGITLYKALCRYTGYTFDVTEAVMKIKSTEARVLAKGVPGYQDYYPAAVGGILALKGVAGKVEVEQLFDYELKKFLETHITLVYSGISRNSGINNWDVYKGFFDGSESVKKALSDIADISYETYLSIKNKDYKKLLNLIGEEGELRTSLADTIVPAGVKNWCDELKSKELIYGMKMCGAGGGGCFVLVHNKEAQQKINDLISESSFTKLDFDIKGPLL